MPQTNKMFRFFVGLGPDSEARGPDVSEDARLETAQIRAFGRRCIDITEHRRDPRIAFTLVVESQIGTIVHLF
jgi:hypothetical protein